MAYFFPLHGKNGQLHGIYMALHEKQAITWQNHVTWQKWELCEGHVALYQWKLFFFIN